MLLFIHIWKGQAGKTHCPDIIHGADRGKADSTITRWVYKEIGHSFRVIVGGAAGHAIGHCVRTGLQSVNNHITYWALLRRATPFSIAQINDINSFKFDPLAVLTSCKLQRVICLSTQIAPLNNGTPAQTKTQLPDLSSYQHGPACVPFRPNFPLNNAVFLHRGAGDILQQALRLIHISGS